MSRILYITYVDYLQGSFPGVEAKISGQTSAMTASGYAVDRINQYGSGARLHTAEGGVHQYSAPLRRFALVRALQDALKQHTYTAAYIRFQFFSEDVRRITRMLQKAGTLVLMEFPTYPYEGELHRQGLRGIPKLVCDRMFRHLCAAHIDAFVTQAEDNTIYGVPCIRVLNGLDFSRHPLREVSQPAPDTVSMAAVASMLPWHGYDRLLLGMAAYYRKETHPMNLQLHLIGTGRELASYQALVQEHGLSGHVVFHGMQGGEALRRIISGCDIAVGSLAAHRIGLKKLSTLKSREYCAWGLPSVNSTPTDILPADDPFCLYIPEDESPVDMEAVIAFYHRVYRDSGMTADEIARAIRERAQQISDVHQVFTPVLDAIGRSCV